MKKIKLSFLIAAHNEEKIIGKTLKHLSGILYKDYEVIIGLDGCTDNTEKIVKYWKRKNNNIGYFKLNLRKGKNLVINSIIKKAKGEIIIINDADWLFSIENKDSILKLVKIFDDEKIGGIAESFPVEWDAEKIKRGDIGYKMVAYSSYLWLEFQKNKYSHKISEELSIVDEPKMFMTNIFRKKLFKDNYSLADDFERTRNIIKNGYRIVFFNYEKMPRMTAIYDKIKISDIYKQKIRTARAREQIKDKEKIGFSDYYFPSIFYIFVNSWKFGVSIGILMTIWLIIGSLATFVSKFKKISTKEGWQLRAKR